MALPGFSGVAVTWQQAPVSRPFEACFQNWHSVPSSVKAVLGRAPVHRVAVIPRLLLGECPGAWQRGTGWGGCPGHLWTNAICHTIPPVQCLGTGKMNVQSLASDPHPRLRFHEGRCRKLTHAHSANAAGKRRTYTLRNARSSSLGPISPRGRLAAGFP